MFVRITKRYRWLISLRMNRSLAGHYQGTASSFSMLAHLISSRENTHFPYADPVSAPMIRTRTEIEAIANPSRRSYLSRHSIPPSWIPATVSIRKSTDHILINDENNGLYWRALNTNEGHVSNNLDIYKVSMAEAFRADQTDGFDLPSFPEFLTLLKIQLHSQSEQYIHPDFYYWLGDRLDGGRPLLLSLNNTLESPSAKLLLNSVRIGNSIIALNLYALDPYRHTVSHGTPRAIELRVRRREYRQNEITFMN